MGDPTPGRYRIWALLSDRAPRETAGCRGIKPFDEPRQHPLRAGQPIDLLDTLIGAQALTLGVVLATGNVREFSPIQGLEVQRWRGPLLNKGYNLRYRAGLAQE